MSYPQTSSQRLLSLLELLQTRKQWNGRVLSERLGVTHRTLRRDIERIRDMGYRVDATSGPFGGYRLTASNSLPPLLFNESEAVAISLSLIAAAASRLVDSAATTQAMAKLQQILPPVLKERVEALSSYVSPLTPGANAVRAGVVGELALACRDHLGVRFRYTKPSNHTDSRSVEPLALVPARNVWYLLAWDNDRDDWRIFRLDRISDLEITKQRHEPRQLAGDVSPADHVENNLRRQRPPVAFDAVLDLSLPEWEAYAGDWGKGSVAETSQRTRWPIRADNLPDAAVRLLWIPADVAYDVEGDPTIVAELRVLAQSFGRGLERSTSSE